MTERDYENLMEETRKLSDKWKSNKWCTRVIIELVGLLEEDDKERRRIAEEVEREMEEMERQGNAA